MSNNIRLSLKIRPNDKVSLFNARKDALGPFMIGDLNLMMDWTEDECDAIIYWKRPEDDIIDTLQKLTGQIKPKGRIWVVIKSLSDSEISKIQDSVVDILGLWSGDEVDIGCGEMALLFTRQLSALTDEDEDDFEDDEEEDDDDYYDDEDSDEDDDDDDDDDDYYFDEYTDEGEDEDDD